MSVSSGRWEGLGGHRVRRGAGWGGSAGVGCPGHSGDVALDDSLSHG